MPRRNWYGIGRFSVHITFALTGLHILSIWSSRLHVEECAHPKRILVWNPHSCFTLEHVHIPLLPTSYSLFRQWQGILVPRQGKSTFLSPDEHASICGIVLVGMRDPPPVAPSVEVARLEYPIEQRLAPMQANLILATCSWQNQSPAGQCLLRLGCQRP